MVVVVIVLLSVVIFSPHLVSPLRSAYAQVHDGQSCSLSLSLSLARILVSHLALSLRSS